MLVFGDPKTQNSASSKACGIFFQRVFCSFQTKFCMLHGGVICFRQVFSMLHGSFYMPQRVFSKIFHVTGHFVWFFMLQSDFVSFFNQKPWNYCVFSRNLPCMLSCNIHNIQNVHAGSTRLNLHSLNDFKWFLFATCTETNLEGTWLGGVSNAEWED